MRQKQHWIKWCRLLLLVLMVLVGWVGCSSENEEDPQNAQGGKPFEGVTIHAAVPAVRGLKSDWEAALRNWSTQLGCEVQVSDYPLSKDSDEVPPTLAKADVLLIPWSSVPDVMSNEGLAAIPDIVRAPDQLHWSGFFSGMRSHAATLDGQPRLVPISCPVLVCYYRKDLLAKAGLSPPKTWDDYQNLLDTLDMWAPGLTAVEPWSESFRASLFLARAAAIAKHSEQFSFCFDLTSGDPLIANPGFVEALQKAQSALAKMPEEVKTYSPGDCRREILAGKAALAIAYETDFNSKTPRSENIQIGISPLPGTRRVYNTSIDEWVEYDTETLHRVTFAGFTGWAIGVRANLEEGKQEQSAWELTRYMVIDQLPQLYPPGMVSLCRDSEMESASRWSGPQLTTSESERYVSAVAESLQNRQFVMELPIIGRREFRAALTEGLTKFLKDGGDEKAVLGDVAEKWKEITRKLGTEKVIRSYRLSHR